VIPERQFADSAKTIDPKNGCLIREHFSFAFACHFSSPFWSVIQ
jgi:hypothetical protein